MKSLDHIRPETVERLRNEYVDRIQQLRNESPNPSTEARLFAPDFEELAREALETERAMIIRLHNQEQLDNQAFRRIQRDIDLAEARLQSPNDKPV